MLSFPDSCQLFLIFLFEEVCDGSFARSEVFDPDEVAIGQP